MFQLFTFGKHSAVLPSARVEQKMMTLQMFPHKLLIITDRTGTIIVIIVIKNRVFVIYCSILSRGEDIHFTPLYYKCDRSYKNKYPIQ
jgi:hypothetical protein